MFDLDHVFVAFAPGSGGNFVTALMQKLVNEDLVSLPINEYGSFHILTNGKREGNDSIAFGSSGLENEKFSSIEQKEIYYIDKIKKEYLNPRKIVTWTHDYTNLPLYKKYFPKSKSLSITAFTPEEKLMSVIMQVNKVFLADEKHIPISLSFWEWSKKRLSHHLSYQIKNILGEDVDTEEIFENRFDSQYNDLIFYLSVRILLGYGNLTDVLYTINEDISDIKFEVNRPRINLRDIISKNSNALLPFSHLPEKNFSIFKKAYSDTLNRTLTSSEENYLDESLEDYYNRQDQFLLRDPIGYFKTRKSAALSIAQTI